jgi:hypothetical protein
METEHPTDIEAIKCFAPDLAMSCADYSKEAFVESADAWCTTISAIQRRH